MKKCELCNSTARMYCESDRASLCRNCDARVHTANSIVAKHSRNLLCHTCQSPTPWNGSGTRLGPSVSLCESCDLENGSIEVDEDDDDDDDDEDEDENENEDEYEDGDGDGDEDEEEEEEEEEDKEEHNEEDDDADSQVVSSSSTSIPPPLPPSSSNSEVSFTGLSRGRNGVYSSNFGFSSASTVEDYSGIERAHGKKRAREH